MSPKFIDVYCVRDAYELVLNKTNTIFEFAPFVIISNALLAVASLPIIISSFANENSIEFEFDDEMFEKTEIALYAILTYVAASKTVDFIIVGVEEYTGITIISDQSEKIRVMIKVRQT